MPESKGRVVRIFGELILIFVGVSLGLMADSFRERNAEARATEDALRLLYDDLVSDSLDFVGVDGTLERHVRATTWLQRNWTLPTVDEDSLGWALRDYLYSPITSFRRATYESISDQNRLPLIDSDSLRSAIVTYYDNYQVELTNGLQNVWDEKKKTVDAFSPYFLRPPGEDDSVAWPLAPGPVNVTSSWSIIRADNVAYNQASFQGVLAEITTRHLRRSVEANAALLVGLRTLTEDP